MFHSRFQNTSPYNLSSRRLTTEKRQKRRGVSPKLYPRKLLITEEKVAADLCNLCINETWQHNQHQTKLRRNPNRQRTVSEIEQSLELSSDEETETKDITITISDEFQEQIKSFKHDILVAPSHQDLKLPPTVKPDYSMALVLWKPNGIVPDIIKHLPPDVATKAEMPQTDQTTENKMMLEEQSTDSSFLSPPLYSHHRMPFQNSSNCQSNFHEERQFVVDDFPLDNEFEDDMMEL